VTKIIPIVPASTGDEIEVSLYAAQEKIYPRSVAGFFSAWRWVTVWITQMVFYGLPWLQWNDRQAVLRAIVRPASVWMMLDFLWESCSSV